MTRDKPDPRVRVAVYGLLLLLCAVWWVGAYTIACWIF